MKSIKDELIIHATETIRKGGSSSLNFRSLGEAAGVKSSTVHYYFPTKGDLLEQITLLYGNNFMSALGEISASKKSAKLQLTSMIDLFISSQHSKLSCLCGMLAIEHEQMEPKVKNALDNFFKALQEWIVTVLKANKIEKPLELTHAKFADLLVTLLEGAILLGRMDAHKSSLNNAKEWIQKAL